MPLIVSLTIIGNKFMPYLGVGCGTAMNVLIALDRSGVVSQWHKLQNPVPVQVEKPRESIARVNEESKVTLQLTWRMLATELRLDVGGFRSISKLCS